MGGIFISYRRAGVAAGYVGRLVDRLTDRFGEDSVFRDVDDIEPGRNFAEAIEEAVASCNALIAVIDPTWATVEDEDGTRRLEDPDDFVRLEIEAALTRGTTVIPVLVSGALMPKRTALPPSMGELSMRQAVTLGESSTDFKTHLAMLIGALERAGVEPIEDEPPPTPARKPTRTRASARKPARKPAPAPEPAGVQPVPAPAPPSLAQLLVGAWTVTIRMPNGYMAQCQLRLMPNQAFDGQLVNPMGTFTVSGQWAVAPPNQLTFQGTMAALGWPGMVQPWFVAQSFAEITQNRLSGWTVAGEAVAWTRTA